MLIHDILGLNKNENIYFVEESFSALKNNTLTLRYLRQVQTHYDAKIFGIRSENGDITGLVLFNPESKDSESFLAIFTSLVSAVPVPNESCRIFSSIAHDLNIETFYTIASPVFLQAIIEYYSISLVKRQLCENCHINKEPYNMVYIESRNARLKEILETQKLHGRILEICCGNGMSTLPMHEAGYNPLCIDYDKCQICQGLDHDVLNPKETAVLDATRLSDFFNVKTFDSIVGFMLGTIYPFNKFIWEKMMSEVAKMLKPGGMILLTVNKEEEIDILKSVLENNGICGRSINNSDCQGIYDQWIYVGNKFNAA